MRRRTLLRFGVGAGCLGVAGGAAARDTPEGEVALNLLRTGDIGALPWIELMLDGLPTRWLVDSGSSTALVSPALAARLRLERRSPIRVATVGGVQTLDRFKLPPLPLPWLGGAESASTAVALDLGPLFGGAAGTTLDGLLGAPWLGRGATTFDFARGRLRWAPEITAVPAGAARLPLRWDAGLPVLALRRGEREPADYLFDTGNAGALVVFAEHARALLAESCGLPEMTVRELGGSVRVRHARIDQLGAPGFVAREVPAALEVGAAARRGGHFDRLAGSLGVALFAAGAVTLDAARGRLIVALPGLPEPEPLPGGFGFTLAPRADGGLTVSGVFDGGPAGLAGIEVGDALLAIDGQATQGWAPARAWQALDGLGEARFEVARSAAEARSVRLARARFFPLLR